jgi:uncharacterized membrane-anchored protein YjiN (DUF445 family)
MEETQMADTDFSEVDMDENWAKNAAHEELDKDAAGQMLRFMMTSVISSLAKELVQDEDCTDEYKQGANDCASRVLGVIDGVMQGQDPAGIETMSTAELMRLADLTVKVLEFRPLD